MAFAAGGGQGGGEKTAPPQATPPIPPDPVPSSWRNRAAVFGLLAGVLLLVHLPLLLGQVYFYRDVGRWLHPARVFLRQALASGASPFYNPAQGLGLAVAASPLYGVFYPTSYLPGFGSEARALSVVLFLHLVWGAAGMFLLALRFRLPRGCAVVAALGWALSGPVTAAFTAGQLLPAASWFPWCAVGGIALAARLRRPSWSAWLAGMAWAALAPAAALLLGEIFQAALATGFGALVALLWARHHPDGDPAPAATPLPVILRALLGTGGALLLASALAAVLLLPLAQAAGETERGAGLSREVAEKWSLHPLRLIELTAPGAMGDPYGAYPGGRWAGDGASDDRPLLYGVYLGASLLVLGLCGVGRGGFAARGLGLLVLVALLLALGRHTPIHAAFRTVIPLFAYQRAPEKFLLAAVPALALLAAFGARRVLADRRALIPPALGAGVVLGALLLGPLLLPEQRVAATIAAGAGHALVALAALVGVAVWLPRTSLGGTRPRLVGALLPAVVILDLALAALPLLVFAPAAMLDAAPPLATLALGAHQGVGRPRVVRDPSVETVLSPRGTSGNRLVQLEALRYATLRPAFLTAHGLATLPGYDAGLPPALEGVWRAGQANALPLMRLLAVDFVVLPVPPGGAVPAGLALVGTPGPPGVGLYRVQAPLPRAYVAGQAVAPPGPMALQPSALFSDEVVTGAAVLLPGAVPGPRGAAGAAAPCTFRRYEATFIEATCRSQKDGHAVFVEQWGQGWAATVDGVPAPLLRANELMRAVPLPAGAHTVALRYTQPGLRAGALVSALAALLVLAGLVLGRRR